jgi:hypothetical protein
MHYKTRRLILWCMAPGAAHTSAHVCPACFARFEAKGRCMSALPNVWAAGRAVITLMRGAR